MYLFMTGYPGFIATRLVRELVKRQKFNKIWLIVLKTPDHHFLKQAQEAVHKDLDDLPIELIEGDITKVDLGITDKVILEKMKTEEGVWWHLAAVYRLDVGEKVAYQVNVIGTKNVLELAKQCKKLLRLNYVSTAYVCGTRLGKILEDDLWDKDKQGFKNFYESTKHEAEVLVRNELNSLPITIYRYGVVVGDSKTGETAKFDGSYFMMKLFDRWGKIPLPYVGAMDKPFNVVPVDFVVEASAAIAARSDTVGKTFHITDPRPWTTKELYRAVAEELGCPRPRLHIPQSLLQLLARSRTLRRMLGFPMEAITYLNHGAEYDCRNTLAALRDDGIKCPELGSYLPTLVAWYKKNRDRKELHVPVD